MEIEKDHTASFYVQNVLCLSYELITRHGPLSCLNEHMVLEPPLE